MIFPRKLYKTLENEINSPEIVVLTGMRRVGKTTLYRQIFEKIAGDTKILDLEN